MNTLSEIAAIIKKYPAWVLVGHVIPDGDCIGSLLGLFWGLNSLGKRVVLGLEDPVPPIYNYLPGSDRLRPLPSDDDLPDAVIFLDCSDEERAGELVQGRLHQRSVTINIDHHATNPSYSDYNYIDDKAAATAELVYYLLKELEVEITPVIAQCLYAGLVMDSGRFMYSSTRPETLEVAAQLLRSGVDLERARIELFESKPREEVLLLKLALQNLAWDESGHIAWMTLAYDDVARIGALNLHPEGIINYTRSIAGVEVGLLIREISPGVCKIGFRSKGKVDVASLAARLGGGGHRQAAGARLEGSLGQVTQRVVQMVREVIS
ncbi:MAG TPA: bifunctional oligoribonuclease/PAP phosphatase NrnA [Syntrophomonadaceae bacterium]|nr:bifunctional oligoribonuclease/PAP phosphatase NrnA [Syntrophomonadaceae bacterium]HQE22710.1 bifunctional oligoribonuclease/PAP phosphatase NrnA [Syntrophomonadaceae bacterium]